MAGTRALLLAGGLGTRLKPLTEIVPKCLIPVGGRPMLDYWIAAIRAAGITDALINTHHHADQVRAYIDVVRAESGLNLKEAYEPELLGSAGTVRANRDWIEDADAVVIIYADNLSDINLGDLVAFHAGHSDPITMMLFHAPVPSACGIATLDNLGQVTNFVEKPKHPASDLANAGLYVVSSEAWHEIAAENAFDFGFDILPRFIGRMRGYVHEGYHLDIGTHNALTRANADAVRLFS